MKINLLYGTPAMSGYLNVDHLGISKDAYHGNIRELTEFVDDAEATEIIAIDVINFFNKNEILSIIDHWVSKLRHEGRIIIGAIDSHSVCKDFCEYSLTISDINSMLYGEEEPYIRKNAITMVSLAHYLETNHKLKILKKQSIEYKILVEAERS